MRKHRSHYRKEHEGSRGFSTLELLLVMVVSLIIAAFAIPGFNQMQRALRISGDGRDLNGAINQAKLRAGADFNRARVYADLAANTFHIETWNKVANCWQTINDPNPCTVAASPVQNLSPGVQFGLGGVGAAPPNTQPAINQAPFCRNLLGAAGGVIPKTACVHFNSRGIPIDPITTAPTGLDAFYITDNTVVYGVTVNIAGLSQVWATSANGTANWYHK
jgi:type II secretory pathway pseudopilin PulG